MSSRQMQLHGRLARSRRDRSLRIALATQANRRLDVSRDRSVDAGTRPRRLALRGRYCRGTRIRRQAVLPRTLVTDDPFVADELSLPTISYFKTPANRDEPATRETTFSLTSPSASPRISASISARAICSCAGSGRDPARIRQPVAWLQVQALPERSARIDRLHGLDWDIGDSGSKRVGAESFSTFTPTLLFGKGFGDLPDDVKYLRPLAVTGTIGIGIPSRTSTSTVNEDGDVVVEQNPNTLQWAFAARIQPAVPQCQCRGHRMESRYSISSFRWSNSR